MLGLFSGSEYYRLGSKGLDKIWLASKCYLVLIIFSTMEAVVWLLMDSEERGSSHIKCVP